MLLNGLAARGYQATLFVFAREGPYFDQLDARVRVEVGRATKSGRLASLRRFLADSPQDVVVSFLSHFTTYASLRLSGSRAKYAISQQTPVSAFLADHDYRWREPWRRRVFVSVARAIYPRADAIAATSSGVGEDLVAHFKVRRDRVTIVPNPVDVAAVRQAALDPIDASLADAGVPTIVTAGRLAHAKNFPLLIEALERLPARVPWRAWILGRGELEGELRDRLARSSVADRVALLGFQPNPWKFMARGDVFVLTSHYEGFGNVLIEAMAVGLPVVATASYGTRDIVSDGVDGLLVDAHEPGAVASAVERVLRDAAVRTRMASAARATAEKYALATVVDRFERVIDGLMRDGRGSSRRTDA